MSNQGFYKILYFIRFSSTNGSGKQSHAYKSAAKLLVLLYAQKVTYIKHGLICCAVFSGTGDNSSSDCKDGILQISGVAMLFHRDGFILRIHPL